MDWGATDWDLAEAGYGTPADFGSFGFTDTTFDVDFGSIGWSEWNDPTMYPPAPGSSDFDGWTDWNGGVSFPDAGVSATNVQFESNYPISYDEPISAWGQSVPPPAANTTFNPSGAINTVTGALGGLTGLFRQVTGANSQAPQRAGAPGATTSTSTPLKSVVDAVGSLTRDLLTARANIRDTANRLDSAPSNINNAIKQTKAMQNGAIPRNATLGGNNMIIFGAIAVGAAFLLLRRQ